MTRVTGFADLRAEFRGWYFWRGVGGILYGRRLNSSPPIVVRAATTEELRDRIREKIRERPAVSGVT